MPDALKSFELIIQSFNEQVAKMQPVDKHALVTFIQPHISLVHQTLSPSTQESKDEEHG